MKTTKGEKKEYRCYGCGVLQEYQGYCLCCKEDREAEARAAAEAEAQWQAEQDAAAQAEYENSFGPEY